MVLVKRGSNGSSRTTGIREIEAIGSRIRNHQAMIWNNMMELISIRKGKPNIRAGIEITLESISMRVEDGRPDSSIHRSISIYLLRRSLKTINLLTWALTARGN